MFFFLSLCLNGGGLFTTFSHLDYKHGYQGTSCRTGVPLMTNISKGKRVSGLGQA